jgi:putative DNA primase/helicase
MRDLVISKGTSRKDQKWKNVKCTWDKLKAKLARTTKTPETMKEYLSFSKTKQDEIKDIGGFVGGELKEGKRRKGYINFRDVLTLDLDSIPATADIVFQADMSYNFSYCIYSTHKHKPDAPRLRIIIPLSRSVKPDEYEAIGRWVASKLDIDYFDDTTFQPERLMYWPSTSCDAEFLFEESSSAEWLDVDHVLKDGYHDWTDISSWCYSSRVNADSIRLTAEKQEDPRSKDGIIGCFCRLYTITEVIEKYLNTVYLPTDANDRYTYALGSTSGGAVVYNDTFIYSHHSTDPLSMKLSNAYDMLRIHMFGELDKDAKEDTPVNRLPSFKKINEFLSEQKEVKEALITENINSRQEAIITDFEDLGDDWVSKLTVFNKNTGELESSINNMYLILENDPKLKQLGRKNTFMDRFEVNKAPWIRIDYPYWADADDSALRHYIEVNYGIEGRQKLDDAFNLYGYNHNYHPVKEYLESLEWDGVKRAEELFIKYLSAEDNIYTREATKKALLAAVKRIYEPGCKFDQMIVLVGPQGIGKSLILKKLGRDWFNDKLQDIKGQKAYEALEGKWIVEIGELAAMNKEDRNNIKNFFTSQIDTYRKAYARNVTDNPRTCIFIGTTNEGDFLNDPTGTRRFWPIDCKETREDRQVGFLPTVWNDFTDKEVDQIWAEMMWYYNNTNESKSVMELSYEAEKLLGTTTEDHQFVSDNVGVLGKYLDILLPSNWEEMSAEARREYIQCNMNDDYDLSVEGTVKRNCITAIEIRKELDRLLSGSSDFLLGREIATIMDSNKDWIRISSIRTKIYGRQRGWRRVKD